MSGKIWVSQEQLQEHIESFGKSGEGRSDETSKMLDLTASPSALVCVITASNQKAIIQTGLIKTVIQEKKGWYHNDPDRDTLLIRFVDGTWERLDMLVEDFQAQISKGVDHA